jgi:FixJ family two-component response regulator
LSRGAISYLEKPVSAEKLQEEFEKIKAFNLKPTRDLLIVEDNPADLKAIT